MRGNFGIKPQNSPKLLRIVLNFIVMQMSEANREKGYCGELIAVQNIDSWRNLKKILCWSAGDDCPSPSSPSHAPQLF